MILGENNEKMSKSRGNVINPDEIVVNYGADTLRLYEMFMGDFEKAAPWSMNSMKGCKRFLDRVWALQNVLTKEEGLSSALESDFNRAIKKVGDDIETLKFNTAIATLMALINKIDERKSITRGELAVFVQLLNPFAPHITEEIWERAGFGGQIAHREWPKYDEAKCRDDVVEIAVQINGKLKGRVSVDAEATEQEALAKAKSDAKVALELAGKNIIKEIYVKGKIVNIVAK